MIIEGFNVGCRDHWYKLFEKTDLRIVQGVIHRFVITGYHNGGWNGGGFYPNDKEWSIKARGFYEEGGDSIYNDENGQPYAKDPMFNDGKTYVCDQDGSPDMYTAHLMKYYYASDRTQKRSDVPFPVLRYADVLLIFAEADNQVNGAPTAAAFEALNKVRNRSYAAPQSSATLTTQAAFRSFVFEERAREFALEGDRRWDLIRYGIYLDVMNKIGTDEANINKTRERKHLLYPIPVDEMLTNKAITSNNYGW
jgi:hypothetical protein